MSKNGRAFYGVAQQLDRVRYVKRSKSTNTIKYVKTDKGKITVFNPYTELFWEKVN